MKKLLKQYLSFVVSIFLVAKFLPGLSYGENWLVLLEASLLLFVLNFSVQPLFNLITMPINILTFGLFALLVNALILYLATWLLPTFKVADFYFPALNLGVLQVKSFLVSSVFSYILVALFLSLLRDCFHWLCSR